MTRDKVLQVRLYRFRPPSRRAATGSACRPKWYRPPPLRRALPAARRRSPRPIREVLGAWGFEVVRDSRIPDSFRHLVPEFQILEFWNWGWTSGILEFWNWGCQKIWTSGILELVVYGGPI